MTIWTIAYTVESADHSGTLAVENESMSTGIARCYVTDHLLRTADVAPDVDPTDIAVSYEPDIE
jgi:hypothetical protein